MGNPAGGPCSRRPVLIVCGGGLRRAVPVPVDSALLIAQRQAGRHARPAAVETGL